VHQSYQGRPYGAGSKNENKTGDICRHAVDEAKDLGQVNQNPFTIRRVRQSLNTRADGEGATHLLPPGAKEVFHGG
jgi:hypothetical protein